MMNSLSKKIVRAILIAAAWTLFPSAMQAEEWTLDECIRYALENSNEVKSKSIDAERGKIAINTAKMSRMPDLSASLGANTYFGRGPSRNGTYVDNSQLSASFGIAASVPVYQGMKIKHEIAQAKMNFEAATSRLELAKDNIELQITSHYLQVLYSMEMVNIAESRLELSVSECRKSLGQYEEGKISKSSYIESQALEAKDKASLVQQENNLMIALLDLRQAMNLPDSVDFSVSQNMEYTVIPDIGSLPSLEEIYEAALGSHPSILAANADVKSSESGLKIAKSAYQPTVSFNAGYGNSFYLNLMDDSANAGFVSQMRNNGNEYLGLTLTIPIYMRGSVRNNVKTSELSLRTSVIALSETEKALKKEIEQAYWGAVAAFSNMQASEKSLESASLAFENERIKLGTGASNMYDYASAKSAMDTAVAELSHAKFDYLLKYRILEFYINL